MTLPDDSTRAPRDATVATDDAFGRFHVDHLWRHGLQVALANFAVACLSASMHGGHFVQTLVYAETIGGLIWLTFEFGRLRLRRAPLDGWPTGWRGAALVVGACVVGYVAGTTLVDAFYGVSSWHQYLGAPSLLFGDIGWTASFCSVVVGWFYFRSRAQAHRAQLAAAAHEATLARLVLLQSQLEPHMLFNTLANLRALIGVDPERAQAMLDRLIDFLRATLNASRVAEHPLRDEFARVDDYLALMKVRMGERLHAALELPPDLATLGVPPLLLQPLVENAIKHGLEPQRGPGELRVTARREGATLVLAVIDSGLGIEAARAPSPGSGFGVAQVRERLHTLYGDAARFTLDARPEGGVRAEIRLPLATLRAQADTPATNR